MGGAIGNVIDRARWGAVFDFADFHIGQWHWPAFNVADSAIVVGVGLDAHRFTYRRTTSARPDAAMISGQKQKPEGRTMRRTILIPIGLCGPRRPRAGRLQLLRESRRRQEGVARRVQDRLAFAAHHAAQCRASAARPGEPRPQEVTPADQAKEALSPVTGRAAAAQPGHDRRGPRPRPHQRRSVAGRRRRAAAASTPTSAAGSTRDTKTINDSDKTFIDSLIFWQDTPPPRRGHRPDQGAAAYPRRPGNGPAAPRGQTPTIKRRQRGLLEGMF